MIFCMEDLRGSAPTLSAKDVLVEVHEDVRQMRVDIAVLRSQDLNARVSLLEGFKSRVVGTSAAGALLAIVYFGRDIIFS